MAPTAPTIDSITDPVAKATPSARPADPIVLDFGKHRRKTVRQLCKGSGKLMEEVDAALDELRSSGAIAPGAQPVIIVVRQKRKRNRGFLPSF